MAPTERCPTARLPPTPPHPQDVNAELLVVTQREAACRADVREAVAGHREASTYAAADVRRADALRVELEAAEPGLAETEARLERELCQLGVAPPAPWQQAPSPLPAPRGPLPPGSGAGPTPGALDPRLARRAAPPRKG
jgi:hypothetical protein